MYWVGGDYLYLSKDDSALGPRPSFTWRNIIGVKDIIIQGSRWIFGDGASLNIWESKWIARPISFKTVAELIDVEHRAWQEGRIRELFLSCDVDAILDIPLCSSWPTNKLIWHYNLSGLFSVKSAYHMIMNGKRLTHGGSSKVYVVLWKSLTPMPFSNVPAAQIWEPSCFDQDAWNGVFGEGGNLEVTHTCTWHPPPMGMLKLNFDVRSMRAAGGGWGFVVHNGDGDIVLAGCKQSSRFLGPEIEEAKAYLFGLQYAKEVGLNNLIVEGNCLPLIQKLKDKK
ncbi:hypothetical protein Cgig2_006394 [Carnegiea gigantea]|uniref:RNase H type-1 domain-containing protein n=1 Tax=Carnegiea gigantea TaxID=171969 RepID=A0A9Q1K6G0_9CARY|nr:hypothetical protein Cgig2_006394 [Carnegiea gigantea]